MIPTAGGCGSSTLSSNDSDHHYNLGLGQNTSSSAHHLSFNTDQSLKTPAIYAGTNKSMISLRSLNDQRPGNNTNLPFINSQLQDHDNPKKQRQNYHGDVAAHGSRTIDSRHSNDKTLGLSDDDDDDLDGDEEDEIDGDFDEEEKNRLNNEKLNFAKSVNDFESCTCGKEHHNDKERKKESDEAKNESEINKSMPNYLNELGNKKLVENISQENATNSIIPQNTSPVKTNHLKLQTGIPDHQYYHIHQKDLIKLPITQEKKPKEKVKLEIINSSSPSTDNEVVLHKNTLPNNPNKIYSRKEVVTTSFKEEIKKSHLEEYRQTTTIYDSTYKPTSESSSSFKPQAADNISNVQNFSNGDYPQICTTQNNALELKQPHSNEIQKKQRSIDQLNHDKRDIDRFISDDNDDEGKRLNLDINKSSNSCSICYDNIIEKEKGYIRNSDKSINGDISNSNLNLNIQNDSKNEINFNDEDLEDVNNSIKIEHNIKSTSKSKHKRDHHKEHKVEKSKKSDKLRMNKPSQLNYEHKNRSSKSHIATEEPIETDRYNSLKKLTKTPVFITSTRLLESVPKNKTSDKKDQINHKNKILVKDQELKRNGLKPIKNDCDFMFISNSDLSNEEDDKPKKNDIKDFNFSLSSAISSSSLSYIKDLPLPSLSSSSSSDFSLISKPLSASSSIDLSSINSSSVDSLRVSMIELSQLSANLNKKIIKSLKRDVGIHGNKHVLVVPINESKKKNNKAIAEIPIDKILIKNEDEPSMKDDEQSVNKYEENDCLNLSSNKKECGKYKKARNSRKGDSLIAAAPRKKSKNKTKKHKEKKSISSERQKSKNITNQREFKSLPRCKNSTNDNEYNSHHNKNSFEAIKMSKLSSSCQAVNQSSYRKVVNSFDLYLTNSIIVNGSTPNKHVLLKKNVDLDNESFRNKEFSSSLSEALSEVGKDNLSILQNNEKAETSMKQDFDHIESLDYSENSNATVNTEESNKTIRQILNKIVKAKISTMSSDNAINNNKTSPLVDMESDNDAKEASNEINDEFHLELTTDLEFIDSQDIYNANTEENIENNEIKTTPVEKNCPNTCDNENSIESEIPLIESEMSISVCLDQVESEQILRVQPNSLDFYPEEEANVIRNTVYKVLEMATEIVAEEYSLTRNKNKSFTDTNTNNDEQRTQSSTYL